MVKKITKIVAIVLLVLLVLVSFGSNVKGWITDYDTAVLKQGQQDALAQLAVLVRTQKEFTYSFSDGKAFSQITLIEKPHDAPK